MSVNFSEIAQTTSWDAAAKELGDPVKMQSWEGHFSGWREVTVRPLKYPEVKALLGNQGTICLGVTGVIGLVMGTAFLIICAMHMRSEPLYCSRVQILGSILLGGGGICTVTTISIYCFKTKLHQEKIHRDDATPGRPLLLSVLEKTAQYDRMGFLITD